MKCIQYTEIIHEKARMGTWNLGRLIEEKCVSSVDLKATAIAVSVECPFR